MKKIFTKLMLLAVAAAALVSCENKIDESTPVVELTQTVTLTAEKPVEVRTEMIEGVPYWSKGDQIGVYVVDGESYKNYAFKNDAEEATLTTSFTGETAVANTLFVYYPYTNFSTPVTEKGVNVEILANQEPTATSFDGRTDLMIAKPVQLDAEGKQLSDLEFARVAAIVKIVLKDNTSSLAGQHISSLTMTAATNLVGRVYLDVVNQEIFTGEGGGLYYGGAKSVNATYTEATQYEVNGTNATYVIVYPQTLKSGSTLSFEATTEGYAISKSIELGQDIVLESGKVTTLNVSLAAANVVKEETGLALPFKDDFARVAYDASEGSIDLSVLGENYSAMDKVYKAKVGNGGVLKLGTSSAEGFFTTTALDLSKPFTVFVEAQRYGTSTSDKLQITVGSQVKTSANLTADSKYYVFEFEAASKKEQVEIRTIKRAYINDLQIVEGHGLDVPTLPAVLTVSKSEISVSHEAATETFTYSVANPVDGVNVAISDNADWITTSTNGTTVTVTVAENTAEEAREGVITVAYTGAESKTVTVKQAAKPAEGGGVVANSVTYTVSSTSACTTSGTAPTGSSAAYTQTYNTKEQLTSGNSATFTLKGYEGATIKGMTLNMKSNASKGAGKFSVVAGSTTLASISSETNFNKWYDNTSYGSTYRDVHVTLTNDTYVIKSGDNVVVKFEATTNSIYIHSITIDYEIGGGSTPEPEPATPVLSINPTTLSFDAAGGNKTVTCTIENEVSGVNVTATESVDWLTTSVSGKTVTITATANTATNARTANVTIAYTGAESKTVTVTQAAAEVVEPEQPGGDATAEVFTLLGKDFGAAASYTTSVQNITSSTDGSVWSVLGYYKQSATAAAVQLGAKSSNYILTPACTNDIATIEITCTGSYTVALWDASTNKVITGMYSKPSATGATGTGGSVKFTLPAGYKQVKIISTRTTNGSSITTSNAATYITKIVVTSK